ncbi:MAG: serine protease inhibitor, partial [bacterium]
SVVQPPPPVEFHADQPFWFAVRDRATGTLLFTGHVADPAAEG